MKIIGVVALILGLSSCSQDPIFAAIEQEIALKDPNVRGLVTSLVKVKSDLYTTNGNIYVKTGGNEEWSLVNTPGSVHYCSMLASSGTELYALFQDENRSSLGVYYYDGSSWTLVSNTSSATFLAGQGTVFAFTGSDSDYTAYTISSGTASAVTNGTGLATPIGASGSYFATTGGVYSVSSGTATSVTGTPTSNIRGITMDTAEANLYVESDGSIYHYNGSAWSAAPVSHGQTAPTSIAYFENGSTKLILVAGTGGYREVVLDGDGVPISAQNPGSSTPSSISTSAQSQYANSVGLWTVHSIFTDSTTIYAGITEKSTSKRGLWAYYQSKGEWNRE